jgi:hypothetical protein
MTSIVLEELSPVENCGNRQRREKGPRGAAKARCIGAAEKRSARLSGNMRACSACAGDYEDPDRTAWPANDEESGAGQVDGDDEFPEEAS